MGAINYRNSDYITLAIKPYDYNDIINDNDFMIELKKEVAEYGGTVEDSIYNYILSEYEEAYINVENELTKYDFNYYHVVIKPGYNEGFYIDIENNYSVAYNSYNDKRNAQKEITKIKQFLLACAGFGLVKCVSDWCPVYYNYTDTIKAIENAVKEMRQEALFTPTWAQYEKVAE